MGLQRRLGRNELGGIGLTLAILAATEIAVFVLRLPSIVGVALLLLALVGPVIAGLRGGVVPALVASAAVTVYTVRYVAPTAESGASVMSGALVMLFLSVSMGLAMAGIKKREDRLKAALEEKARALAERNADLASINETLEAFSYVVSHDLKEPVRAIDNYLQAIEEDWGTPEGKRHLERAQQANARLIGLVRGLLEYSRASMTPADLHGVPLAPLIESDSCRTMFDPLLDDRGGSVEVDPRLPAVLGDELVLCQLFGNLIVNALKHGGEKPRVIVRAIGEAPDGRVQVAVDDNGPGFPKEVLERFSHLRNNRPSTVRGGFGLTISQRAAARLRGRLTLGRSPEGGARVQVELPPAPEAPARRTADRIFPQGRQ